MKDCARRIVLLKLLTDMYYNLKCTVKSTQQRLEHGLALKDKDKDKD